MADLYDAAPGAAPEACDSTDVDCGYYTEACSTSSDCFELGAGALVGVSLPSDRTVVWGTPSQRPARRRSRTSRRTRQRRIGG
jgi:hypothetical protein